jgi:acetyltransferase-like isoleucine patch superfamily enzyme/SAM-dependent methyltransferase
MRLRAQLEALLMCIVAGLRSTRSGIDASGNLVDGLRIDCRGGAIENRVRLGSNSVVSCYIVLEREVGSVRIGNDTFIGGSSLVCANEIVIGDRVLISWGCTIIDHDSHSLDYRHRRMDQQRWREGLLRGGLREASRLKDWSTVPSAPIRVLDDAWVGMNATILKGVTIGNRSVVAAGSMVTKDVPDDAVVAGNPARVIRHLSDDALPRVSRQLDWTPPAARFPANSHNTMQASPGVSAFDSWESAVEWLCSQPEHRELARACYFDDPLLDAAKRFHVSGEWAAVRPHLPSPPGSAIDVGAGRGIASYALSADGWTTTAVEPNPSKSVGADAIRALAQAAALPIDVVQAPGEALPFADATFDLAYCRQALHHARDLRQLCREIGRILKPGGVFIATREHVLSRAEDLATFLAEHPLHYLYGGEHAYTLTEYKSAISGAGLALVRTLNPLASDINMFPSTMRDTKRRWAARLGLNRPGLIPHLALRLRGHLLDQPGRLYSFIAVKPHA